MEPGPTYWQVGPEKDARLRALVAKRWRPKSGSTLFTELEKERSRIARELHAGAGQPLAGIKLHLEILEQSASGLTNGTSKTSDPPDSGQADSIRTTIGRLQTLAEQALGQVRAVSHRLHPPDWQEIFQFIKGCNSFTIYLCNDIFCFDSCSSSS